MGYKGKIRTRVAGLTAGLLLGAVAMASAQSTPPSPNAFGLYFDGEAGSSEITLTEPGTVDAFLVYTDPAIPFLNGWEVKVTASAGTTISDVSLPVGTTAVLTGPQEWSAVLAEPMPGNTLTKLAVFTLTIAEGENTYLYLGGLDNPAVPGGLPAVRTPDGTWSAVPVASGDPSLPVASINATTPTATQTWGSVKVLFR